MTMNSIEDHRGIFGPEERVMMQRNTGIRIEIPEPSITPEGIDGAVPPPIDLDGGLQYSPREEPQNIRNIGQTMQQIHKLSQEIACADGMRNPMQLQTMTQIRADLTRQLPDVF